MVPTPCHELSLLNSESSLDADTADGHTDTAILNDVPSSTSATDPELTTTDDPEQTSTSRKFPMKWLTDFPWIDYDKVSNTMWCKVCRKCKRPGPLSSGTRNFR